MFLFCSYSGHFLGFFLFSPLCHHLNFMNLTFHITFSRWFYRQLYFSSPKPRFGSQWTVWLGRSLGQGSPGRLGNYSWSRSVLYSRSISFTFRSISRLFNQNSCSVFSRAWKRCQILDSRQLYTHISFNLTFFLVFFVLLLNVFMHLLEIFLLFKNIFQYSVPIYT